LIYEFQGYELGASNHPNLWNKTQIVVSCEGLAKTWKSIGYDLVDRLLHLVVTLPVSTTTTKQFFLLWKLSKQVFTVN